MAAVLIRDFTIEEHRALKMQAKKNGRSLSAEVRAILEEAMRPKERMKVGTEIRKLVGKYGGVDLEITRDNTPVRFPDFSDPEFERPETE